MRRQSCVLLIAAVLVASDQDQPARQIFDRSISAALRLRITVSYTENEPGVCCTTLAHVFLVDNNDLDHAVEIASISDDHEITVTVQRADDQSVVLSRADPDYGIDQGSLKLFFDPRSKRLLKRIDFDTSHSLTFANDADVARQLHLDLDTARVLRRRRVLSVPEPHIFEEQLPRQFEAHPLPQSTYPEFAHARPGRVRDGYGANGTTLEEGVGPYQVKGGSLWFGKTFYDGEGFSGVGDVGYLVAGKYTMLAIHELTDWSVSALLVEDGVVWAGRASHGEGAAAPGGLIRFDRTTHRVRVYDVPNVIHAIAHVGSAIFLATDHGLYVINGTTRTRYRAEPDIDGAFIVVRERL